MQFRSKLALLAVAVVCLAVAGYTAVSGLAKRVGPMADTKVRVMHDGRLLLVRDAAALRRLSRTDLERRLSAVPSSRRVRRGRARVTLRTDVAALVVRVGDAARRNGGEVVVPEHAVSSSARVPVVQQALKNNCETAALSMVLADQGKRTSQLTLQNELPRSGPLDPSTDAEGQMLWGDPDRGFVGRPDGGGAAGGYGVYQGPIRQLAARHGVRLESISGSSPSSVYKHLLNGQVVMAWVGLSDGPYKTWATPEGGKVRANFGEHAIVITGIRGQSLAVNNSLTGQQETWSKSGFEHMWERLGRRALSTN